MKSILQLKKSWQTKASAIFLLLPALVSSSCQMKSPAILVEPIDRQEASTPASRSMQPASNEKSQNYIGQNLTLGALELKSEGPAKLYHEIECPPDLYLRILESEQGRFFRNFVELGLSWRLNVPPGENFSFYSRYRCIPR